MLADVSHSLNTFYMRGFGLESHSIYLTDSLGSYIMHHSEVMLPESTDCYGIVHPVARSRVMVERAVAIKGWVEKLMEK